ncbi:DUF378 domain-containing protein [Patescibacteria group bacterium]|nr:DUF378 domain-containing protein [Patescibacteria group bacterium]
MQNSVIKWVVGLLLVVGGLNWGLIGFNSSWNVVEMVFGGVPLLVQLTYWLVGLAALYKLAKMVGVMK